MNARIRAALHRLADSEPFALGDLAIDYERRRVTVGARTVQVTATEYEVLRILSLNAGRVVTYDALLRQVWGRWEVNDSNPVRTVIRKLRHKLGDAAATPAYILTERGVGYRLAEPDL